MEEIFPFVAEYLQNFNERLELRVLSKHFNTLFMNSLHKLKIQLEEQLAKYGGEFLADEEFKEPPEPIEVREGARWECLQRAVTQCRYYGSEENMGFCSGCVKTQNPSEDTLLQWNKNREEASRRKIKEQVKEWKNINVRKMEELFDHTQNIKKLLAKLDNLHSLEFSKGFSIKIVPLPTCHNLRCLLMPRVPITNEMISIIATTCLSLNHLDISQGSIVTKISTQSFFPLFLLPQLQHLNLMYCLTEPLIFFTEVPVAVKLRSLSLRGCLMNFNLPEAFTPNWAAKFPNLEGLDLKYCGSSKQSLLALKDLPKLRVLDLHGNSVTGSVLMESTFFEFATQLPQLEHLFISYEARSNVEITNPKLKVYVDVPGNEDSVTSFICCNFCKKISNYKLEPHPRQGKIDPSAKLKR